MDRLAAPRRAREFPWYQSALRLSNPDTGVLSQTWKPCASRSRSERAHDFANSPSGTPSTARRRGGHSQDDLWPRGSEWPDEKERGTGRFPNHAAAIALCDSRSRETPDRSRRPNFSPRHPQWAHQNHGPQDQIRQLATVYIRFSTNVVHTTCAPGPLGRNVPMFTNELGIKKPCC
jgi:hypothetical protein